MTDAPLLTLTDGVDAAVGDAVAPAFAAAVAAADAAVSASVAAEPVAAAPVAAAVGLVVVGGAVLGCAAAQELKATKPQTAAAASSGRGEKRGWGMASSPPMGWTGASDSRQDCGAYGSGFLPVAGGLTAERINVEHVGQQFGIG